MTLMTGLTDDMRKWRSFEISGVEIEERTFYRIETRSEIHKPSPFHYHDRLLEHYEDSRGGPYYRTKESAIKALDRIEKKMKEENRGIIRSSYDDEDWRELRDKKGIYWLKIRSVTLDIV